MSEAIHGRTLLFVEKDSYRLAAVSFGG